MDNNIKIGIVGLGYVGLLLAIEFARVFETRGFDIDVQRIKEFTTGIDKTLEIKSDDLLQSNLKVSDDINGLSECNVFIITVPTPIDSFKKPDLGPLKSASKVAAKVLKTGRYIADFVMRLMSKKRIHIVDSNILVLGFTFKENCTDLRNTRVIDLIKGLEQHNANIDVYDPWVNKEEVYEEFKLDIIDKPEIEEYDAIILAVAHNEFIELGANGIHALGKNKHVLYDIKSILPIDQVDARL